MKVNCYVCGDMCFDGCKDEGKDLLEHYEGYSHKISKGFGFGKYHLFGMDHIARYFFGENIKEFIDQLENCGGYIP